MKFHLKGSISYLLFSLTLNINIYNTFKSEIEKSLKEENSHFVYFIQDVHNLSLHCQHDFVNFLVRNSPQYPSKEKKYITTVAFTNSKFLNSIDCRLVSITLY